MTGVTDHPPLLLYRHTQPLRSALEHVLASPISESISQSSVQDALDGMLKHSSETTSLQTHLFVQYIISLYITALCTDRTSFVYRNILNAQRTGLLDAFRQGKITDPYWQAFIREAVLEYDIPVLDQARVEKLQTIAQRLQPEATYRGSDDLLALVGALYSERGCRLESIMLYRVELCRPEGYTEPTLALVPVVSRPINTHRFTRASDLSWKLLYSAFLPIVLTEYGDLRRLFYSIAALALPMDPIALTNSLSFSITQNRKSGIPFRNYMAMYLKQRMLGLDYRLSRLADPRRRLLQRLHRFCGVGATCLADAPDVHFLLSEITAYCAAATTPPPLTDEEEDYLRYFQNLDDTSRAGFTTGLSYTSGLEAATKTPQPPAADDTDDEGAFANDADTTKSSADAQKTTDDNIDRSGEDGQSPAPDTINTIIPLALPSETIDDHILRLMLLHYVTTAKQDDAPAISAETLTVLEYWCENWLFLASISLTKKLITQLKLTEHLKELTA